MKVKAPGFFPRVSAGNRWDFGKSLGPSRTQLPLFSDGWEEGPRAWVSHKLPRSPLLAMIQKLILQTSKTKFPNLSKLRFHTGLSQGPLPTRLPLLSPYVTGIWMLAVAWHHECYLQNSIKEREGVRERKSIPSTIWGQQNSYLCPVMPDQSTPAITVWI